MLTVRTKIDKSRIHEIGIFSLDAIKKGDVVWTFQADVDRKYSPKQMKALPEIVRKRLESLSYVDKNGCYILCGDDARFFNHEDNPNCIDSFDKEETRAARDIEAGEELTCNYRTFDKRFASKRNIFLTVEQKAALNKKGLLNQMTGLSLSRMSPKLNRRRA